MTSLQIKTIGDAQTTLLEGRPVKNGDELELRLRGNRGWATVTVQGLPQLLKVNWESDDGTRLQATLSDDIELRWP